MSTTQKTQAKKSANSTKEQIAKKSNVLYFIPEKLEGNTDRQSKEWKAFRSKLRKNLSKFYKEIALQYKISKKFTKEIQDACKAFKAYAKSTYVNGTDWKTENFYQGNKESQQQEISFLMEIMEKYESGTKRKRSTSKKSTPKVEDTKEEIKENIS